MAEMNQEWAERIAKIEHIELEHANFQRVRAAIKTCVTMAKYGRPVHLALTGPAGVGKTIACKSLIKDYRKDPIVANGFRRKRVGAFYSQLKSPISIPGIMQVMLKALGDPYPLSGSWGNREDRIFTLLDSAETELIMMDEFHHLEAEGAAWSNAEHSSEVINWLKWLLDNLKIPLVLAGTPKVLALIKSDGQLSRRIEKRLAMAELPLTPFTSDPIHGGADVPGDFCSYSDQFAIEVAKVCEVTYDLDMSHHFTRMLVLAITGGNLSAIASLHRLAIMNSVAIRGDGRITMDDMRSAASEDIFEDFMLTAQNPFHLDSATLLQQLKDRGVVDEAVAA